MRHPARTTAIKPSIARACDFAMEFYWIARARPAREHACTRTNQTLIEILRGGNGLWSNDQLVMRSRVLFRMCVWVLWILHRFFRFHSDVGERMRAGNFRRTRLTEPAIFNETFYAQKHTHVYTQTHQNTGSTTTNDEHEDEYHHTGRHQSKERAHVDYIEYTRRAGTKRAHKHTHNKHAYIRSL